MARAPQVMTDDDDDRRGGSDVVDLPAGLSGQNVEIPQERQRQQAEPEIEIIPTDEHFQPLQAQTDQQSDQEPEPSLASQEEQQQQPRHRQRNRREEREARRQGRDRTFAEVARLNEELANLRTIVSGFEPRLSETERNSVQRQISDLDRQIEQQTQYAQAAGRQMAEAMSNSDPEGFAKALDARDKAVRVGTQLESSKNLLVQGLTAADQRRQQADGRSPIQLPPQQQQQRQPPIRPAVQERIQDFADAHPWYASEPNSRDAQIVRLIDNEVANEGFDPASDDYWDEIEDRIRDVLPHRFGRQQSQPRQANGTRQPQPQQQVQPQRRGPMVAGGGERNGSPAPRPNQFYMSPDRAQALIAAGALEADGKTVANREKFQRYVRQFQAYDAANGIGARQ